MTKIYRMNLTAPNFFVDTHFHVFAAGQAIAGARYVPAYSARVEDWMAQAQPLGVLRVVERALLRPEVGGHLLYKGCDVR